MSTAAPQDSVAYLGPRGSFAEAAVLAWPGSADAELLPSTSVPAALEAVRGDAVDHALVPIENSVEGSVSATLDELGSGQRLVIVDEVVLPVQFSLLVRPGTTLDQVSRIATHPHAQAQVRWWLAEHLPEASVIPAMSTAAACRRSARRSAHSASRGVPATRRATRPCDAARVHLGRRHPAVRLRHLPVLLHLWRAGD